MIRPTARSSSSSDKLSARPRGVWSQFTRFVSPKMNCQRQKRRPIDYEIRNWFTEGFDTADLNDQGATGRSEQLESLFKCADAEGVAIRVHFSPPEPKPMVGL